MVSGKTSFKKLSWTTGVDYNTVVDIVKELSKNYVFHIDDNMVLWDPADNPSNINLWGWRLVHEPFLGSTQGVAKKYGPWTVVVAERLVKARGRHGKLWKTDFGGLWFTVSFTIPPEQATLLPLAVPVMLVNILNNSYKINAKIKWPNDIVVRGKKLAGIVLEAEAFPNNFIVYVGIGINVNNDVGLEEAISLKQIIGLKPRNSLLASIISLFTRINSIVRDKEKLMKNYLNNLETLGRKVILETPAGQVEGVVENVKESGSIVVRTVEGEKVFDPMFVYRVRYKD